MCRGYKSVAISFVLPCDTRTEYHLDLKPDRYWLPRTDRYVDLRGRGSVPAVALYITYEQPCACGGSIV